MHLICKPDTKNAREVVESLELLPGCVIVGVQEPDDHRALDTLFASDRSSSQQVVVICVHLGSAEDLEDATGHLNPERLIDDHVTAVLSEIVFSAEKAGKPVKLLTIPGSDIAATLLAAAASLCASDLWLGSSCSRLPEKHKKICKALGRLWPQISMASTLPLSTTNNLSPGDFVLSHRDTRIRARPERNGCSKTLLAIHAQCQAMMNSAFQKKPMDMFG